MVYTGLEALCRKSRESVTDMFPRTSLLDVLILYFTTLKYFQEEEKGQIELQSKSNLTGYEFREAATTVE